MSSFGRRKIYVDSSNVIYDSRAEKPANETIDEFLSVLDRPGSFPAYDTLRAFTPSGTWTAIKWAEIMDFNRYPLIKLPGFQIVESAATFEYINPNPGDFLNPFRTERQKFVLEFEMPFQLEAKWKKAYFKHYHNYVNLGADTPTQNEISKNFLYWWFSGPTSSGDQDYGLNADGEPLQGSRLIDVGKIFTDHYFTIDTPIPYLDLNELSGIKGLYAKTVPEYNFFIKQYEHATTITPAPGFYGQEPLFPNMYVFLSEQEYLDNTKIFESYSTVGTPYSDLLTINGKIENVLQDVMTEKQSKNVAGPIGKIIYGGTGVKKDVEKIKVGEKDIGDYFLKWSKAADEGALWTVNINNFRNMCFTNYDTAIFEQAETKKHLFPMHIGIEFSTDVVAGFSDLLYNTKFMYSLMNFVHKSSDDSGTLEKRAFTELDKKTEYKKALTEDTKTVTDNKLINSWDILQWLNGLHDFEASSFVPVEEEDLFPLGNRSDLFAPGYKNKFYKALLLFKFKSVFKKYVESARRTYMDIIKGKESHSETVFYKIEKLNKQGTLIQNIYIPNSSNSDIIKYYDTTVIYNKEYTYNIYAYVLVVGNKYEYEQAGIAGGSAALYGSWIEVDNRPSVKLFEIPYHSSALTKVVDSPPIYPEVDIIPYRGIDNKLKFNFSSNTGRYFAKPIWFNDGEKQLVTEIKDAQHVNPGEPLEESTVIMFESDDPVKKYEIYKISPPESDADIPLGFYSSYKPKSYEDFGTPYNILENIDSWIDYNVRPNRKYYYMFRAIDQHDHFSNPSPIFQVEIINNSGAIYPLIKIVEFEKPTLKVKKKSFRKYMQIIPAFEQGLIHNLDILKEQDSSTAFGQTPQLGTLFSKPSDDEKAPDKKFKIRLTSKSTGKKLDINVKFTHKHDNNDILQEEILQ